jgi:hypothetical protein
LLKRLPLSVYDDFEFVFAQIGDRMTLVVQSDSIDRGQGGSGSESRLL